MAEDELPTKLPKSVVFNQPIKFGPQGIDYSINQQLKNLIPAENSVELDLMIRSGTEQRFIKGVVATRFGEGGKWGAALGAALDLDNTKNWEVEIVGVRKL